MHFGNFGSVSSGKVQELEARLKRLGVNLALVEEQFIRGGGKGGQKINKTSSTVVLHYPPLELSVRCQKERLRPLNRFFALRELAEEIEFRISPETSPRRKEWEKIRKQKARRRRRSGI